MNQEAIALAADSAVTGPSKIFKSANKIFALSKYHPVGVMVFDNASFLGVPWETIIKQYRRQLGGRCFPTLQDHADDFLKFFNRGKEPFGLKAQEWAVGALAIALFRQIRFEAFRLVEVRMERGEELTREEVVAVIEGEIDQHFEAWKGAEARKGLPKSYRESVAKRYRALTEAAIGNVFERVEFSAKAMRQLMQLLPELAVKDLRFDESPFHSGIVIAGFGSEDVYPCLRRFHFEGMLSNRLKFTEDEPVDIGRKKPERAFIVPFAQAEQVETFMEGIDPDLRRFVHDWIHEKLEAFSDEIANQLNLSEQARGELAPLVVQRSLEIAYRGFSEDLTGFSNANHVQPIIDIVGMLPKDELAEMAESLVNLTSFKRRVTPEAETVGGPIDVAVISRGDGFIWIKRKHYFKPELNPHFLTNYYREENHEQKQQKS